MCVFYWENTRFVYNQLLFSFQIALHSTWFLFWVRVTSSSFFSNKHNLKASDRSIAVYIYLCLILPFSIIFFFSPYHATISIYCLPTTPSLSFSLSLSLSFFLSLSKFYLFPSSFFTTTSLYYHPATLSVTLLPTLYHSSTVSRIKCTHLNALDRLSQTF